MDIQTARQNLGSLHSSAATISFEQHLGATEADAYLDQLFGMADVACDKEAKIQEVNNELRVACDLISNRLNTDGTLVISENASGSITLSLEIHLAPISAFDSWDDYLKQVAGVVQAPQPFMFLRFELSDSACQANLITHTYNAEQTSWSELALPLVSDDEKLIVNYPLMDNWSAGPFVLEQVNLPLQIYSISDSVQGKISGVAATISIGDFAVSVEGQLLSRALDCEISLSTNELPLPDIQELAALVDLDSLVSTLPDGLNLNSACSISSLKLKANLREPRIDSVFLSVDLDVEWPLFRGTKVDEIQLQLSVPFSSGKPDLKHVNALVTGMVQLGDALFQISISLPEKQLAMELDEGSYLSLSELAEAWGIPCEGLPACDLTDISCHGGWSENGPYASFSARVEGVWPIANSLELIELAIDFDSRTNHISLWSALELADCRFMLSGSWPEMNLSGAMGTDNSLSLGSLIHEVVSSNVELPDELAAVTLSKTQIACNGSTGKCSFSGAVDFACSIGQLQVAVESCSMQAELDFSERKTWSTHLSGAVALLGHSFAYSLYGGSDNISAKVVKTSSDAIGLSDVLELMDTSFDQLRNDSLLMDCNFEKLIIEMDISSGNCAIVAEGQAGLELDGIGSFYVTVFHAKVLSNELSLAVDFKLGGELKIGSLLLDAELLFLGTAESYEMDFRLTGTDPVYLSHLYRDMLPGIPDNLLPDVVLKDIDVVLVDEQQQMFEASAALDIDWDIPGLKHPLTAKFDQLQFQCVNGKMSGALHGQFELANVCVHTGLEFPACKLNGKLEPLSGSIDFKKVLADIGLQDDVLPPMFQSLVFESIDLEVNVQSQLFELEADLDCDLELVPGVMFHIDQLKLKLDSSAQKMQGAVSVFGALSQAQCGKLDGQLMFELGDDLTVLKFVPSEESNINISLPQVVPDEAPISLVIKPKTFEVSLSSDDDFSFVAGLQAEIHHLPSMLDSIVPDEVEGKLKLDGSGLKLTVSSVIEDINIPLPNLETYDGQSIAIGSVVLAIRDISVTISDSVSLSAELCCGVPGEVNYVFGCDDSGEPPTKIFKAYENDKPETMSALKLTLDESGFFIEPIRLPLKGVEIKKQADGKYTIDADLGDWGAFEAKVPRLALNVDSGSFTGSGDMSIKDGQPLKIPVEPFKPMLEKAGLGQDVINSLPDGFAVKSFSLLNGQGELDGNALVGHLEQVSGISLPGEFKQFVSGVSDAANRLPEKLLSYLSIQIPQSFAFDISITTDGGARIKVMVDEDHPISLIYPSYAGLIGLRFRSFTFGEILGGQLFLLKLDVVFDYFSYPDLVAALSGLGGASRSSGTTIEISDLTTLISYQTSVPIPIPLFYDKLSIDHGTTLGDKIYGELRCPEPSLNIQELGALFGEFVQFASDENHLLDDDLELANVDLKFQVGPGFIRLPDMLGGVSLGDPSKDLLDVSAYEVLANVLNAGKQFSFLSLFDELPAESRSGAVKILILGMQADVNWAFSSGASKPGHLRNQLPVMARLLKSTRGKAGPEIRLAGAIVVGNGMKGTCAAVCRMGQDAGVAIRIESSIAQDLLALHVQGECSVSSSFSAKYQLIVQGHTVMSNDVSVNGANLSFSGECDFAPRINAIGLKADVKGDFGALDFSIQGTMSEMRVGLLQMNGAELLVSSDEFRISGKLFGCSSDLILTSQSDRRQQILNVNGKINGSISAGALRLSNISVSARCPLRGAPLVSLCGTVQMLGLTQTVNARLTPQGACSISMNGQLMGRFDADIDVHFIQSFPNVSTAKCELIFKQSFITSLKGQVTSQLEGLVSLVQKQMEPLENSLEWAEKTYNEAEGELKKKRKELSRTLKRAVDDAKSFVGKCNASISKFQREVDKAVSQLDKMKPPLLKAKEAEIKRLAQKIKDNSKEIKACRETVKRCGSTSRLGKQNLSRIKALLRVNASHRTGRKIITKDIKLMKDLWGVTSRGLKQTLNSAKGLLNEQKKHLKKLTRDADNAQLALDNIDTNAALRPFGELVSSANNQISLARRQLQQFSRSHRSVLQVVSSGTGINVSEVYCAASLSEMEGGKVQLQINYHLLNKKRQMQVSANLKDPGQLYKQVAAGILSGCGVFEK